jgi:copper(I)-binding protein
MTRILFALALLLPVAAVAQSAGKITVEAPWARASAGTTGAAYLTVKNAGDAEDRLVAVSTPAAAKAEIHTTTMEGDVMKMRPVDAVPVAAHGTAELKPGGLHVMLMELKAPLKQGDTIPLTLKFEKAGDVPVTVAVQGVGAAGPGSMGNMPMGNMPMGNTGSAPMGNMPMGNTSPAPMGNMPMGNTGR